MDDDSHTSEQKTFAQTDGRHTWEQKTFAPTKPHDIFDSTFNKDVRAKSRLLVESAPPYLNITQNIADNVAKHVCYNEKMMQSFVEHPAYQFIMNVASFTNDNVAKYWSDNSTLVQPTPYNISPETLDSSTAFAKEQADRDVHRWCKLVSTGIHLDFFCAVWDFLSDEGNVVSKQTARTIIKSTANSKPISEINTIKDQFVDLKFGDVIYGCMNGIYSNIATRSGRLEDRQTLVLSPSVSTSVKTNRENTIRSIISPVPMISLTSTPAAPTTPTPAAVPTAVSALAAAVAAAVKAAVAAAAVAAATVSPAAVSPAMSPAMSPAAVSPAAPTTPTPAAPTTPTPAAVPAAVSALAAAVAAAAIAAAVAAAVAAATVSPAAVSPAMSPAATRSAAENYLYTNEFNSCIGNPILFQKWLHINLARELVSYNIKYRLSSDNIIFQDLTGVRLTNETPYDKQETNWKNYWYEVQNFFNRRFEFHFHQHLLTHYEEKIAFETRKWYGNTPNLRNGIYFSPVVYGHMNEIVHALTHVYASKFNECEAEDFIWSKNHRYLFSKCVALAIRASQVLSGKRYGLDKSYMRVNLERRKAMAAWKHVGRPPKAPHRASDYGPIDSGLSNEETLKHFSNKRRRF